MKFIKQILNYFYVIGCFKVVLKTDIITKTYMIKVKDSESIQNPRMTKLGVLYLFLTIPKEIAADLKEQYVAKNLDLLNRLLLEMELIGSVTVTRREFTQEDENTLILVKYIPVFTKSALIMFLIYVTLIIFLIIKYKVILNYFL
jgi:hypothetical protein